MELGRIKNIHLYPDTKTTLLISELCDSDRSFDTFCMYLSSYMTYRNSSGISKSFAISLYLTNYIPNVTKYNDAYITFTQLKRDYTRCFWETTDNMKEELFLVIRDIVMNHLDLQIGESMDCFFENPLILNAQGNWMNRYWGETSLYCLPGIKLERVL